MIPKNTAANRRKLAVAVLSTGENDEDSADDVYRILDDYWETRLTDDPDLFMEKWEKHRNNPVPEELTDIMIRDLATYVVDRDFSDASRRAGAARSILSERWSDDKLFAEEWRAYFMWDVFDGGAS